nr:MAG TPA: hypothetical protein [Caudoviricetes sp.]
MVVMDLIRLQDYQIVISKLMIILKLTLIHLQINRQEKQKTERYIKRQE